MRVRVYTPTNAQGKLPGLIYIHGGGMILGSIEGEEASCIAMCEKLGIVVATSVSTGVPPGMVSPLPLRSWHATARARSSST